MRGFLEARRSWEPSSSITTGKFFSFPNFAEGVCCERPLDWTWFISFFLTKILEQTLSCVSQATQYINMGTTWGKHNIQNFNRRSHWLCMPLHSYTHPRLICRGQTPDTQKFLLVFFIFRDSSHSLSGWIIHWRLEKNQYQGYWIRWSKNSRQTWRWVLSKIFQFLIICY
jgi:hypothetical protein